MKQILYKQIITLFIFGFIANLSAQKFDKTVTEKFNVNKEVVVKINASNTDINVTTWNKNEVQVDAFIEIEGVSKEEAEKYFKNWQFEALGNKRKVEITSKGNSDFNFKNDFVFFDNMNFDFKMPTIDSATISAIYLPDMDFDFDLDKLLEGIENLGENMEQSGNYEFMWKDDDYNIVIKSKEEWEAFKKSKEYKLLKEKMMASKAKVRAEFAESKEKMKKQFKASFQNIKIDKEQVRKELEKAKETLKNLNLNFTSSFNEMSIDGQKVKIKKRIEIKVPKNATFDLNTRHCKVTLPNIAASGAVNYGSFDAENLLGGRLTINYAPVTIKDLNACTLFLNNVTDAKIASVTNTTMSNNSSGLVIDQLNQNVELSDKFGDLSIINFADNFGEFILNLKQSNAKLNLGNVSSKYKYNVNRIKLENKRAGKVNNENTTNLIQVNGEYSTLIIE